MGADQKRPHRLPGRPVLGGDVAVEHDPADQRGRNDIERFRQRPQCDAGDQLPVQLLDLRFLPRLRRDHVLRLQVPVRRNAGTTSWRGSSYSISSSRTSGRYIAAHDPCQPIRVDGGGKRPLQCRDERLRARALKASSARRLCAASMRLRSCSSRSNAATRLNRLRPELGLRPRRRGRRFSRPGAAPRVAPRPAALLLMHLRRRLPLSVFLLLSRKPPRLAGLVLLATDVLALASPVAVAASTLVAATLFSPLRRRVQRVVDRRFNRARYDADKTVAAFAARLKDAVNLDAVRDDLSGVVHQALEPAHASVWISHRD